VSIGLTAQNGTLAVMSPFSAKAVVSNLPGALWDRGNRCWTFPLTYHAIRQCLDAFAELGTTCCPVVQAIIEQSCDEELPHRHHAFTVGAWRHQDEAMRRVYPLFAACHVGASAGYMFDFEMGTGKTRATLDIITADPAIRKILVVCPGEVVDDVWIKQTIQHTAGKIRPLRLDESAGSTAKRAKAAEAHLRLCEALSVPALVAINFEAVWRKAFAKFAAGVEWDLLIIDEAHRAKAPGGKASMWLGRFAANIPRRLLLTGTPMPHSPLDIYAQFRILDPSVFGRSFTRFKARYAITRPLGSTGVTVTDGYQRLPELSQRMRRLAYRVKLDEVMDLPPAIHNTLHVDLCPEARKAYESLRDDIILWREEGEVTVTADNALTKLLRLQQITSGHLGTDQGETLQLGTDKRAAFAGYLEDLAGHVAVVFCRFIHDLASVALATKAAGREYYEISGRRKQLPEWNATRYDDGAVIGIQIQSGGLGIDLTKARHCVHYSLGFSLGDYLQSLARLRRAGQEHSVHYTTIVARDSVDEKVVHAIAKREQLVESVLRAL